MNSLGKIANTFTQGIEISKTAYYIPLTVTTLSFISHMMFHEGYIKSIVKSETGVEIPLTFMCEWQATVPMMFFLVQSLNSTKKNLDKIEIFAIVCVYTGISISVLCYIADYFHQMLLGIIGTILLIIANYISIVQAQKDVISTHETYNGSNASAGIDEYIAHKLALKRYESSIIIAVIFTIFAVLYFAVELRLITGSQSCLLTLIINTLAKNFYSQILTSGHLKVLDYSAYSILSERKLNTDRRYFLRFLFHELRSPLNCIHMALQLQPVDLEVQETMRVAAMEINNLLDDSLLLQSIIEGSLALTLRPSKVDDIVSFLKDSYKVAFKGRAAIVKIMLKKGLPELIEIDLPYIRRVIENLVTAINQHIEVTNELMIIIILSYDSETSIFSLEIQDNDKNFKTDEVKDYSYGEYHQYNHNQLNVGRLNSLRMSICNQIITLYGGLFGFQLNSIGVKFKFAIPVNCYKTHKTLLDKEITLDDTSKSSSSSHTSTAITNKESKIQNTKLNALVVDDIKTNRQLLAKLLKNRDLEVDMVENGQKATEYVQDNHDKISIIFMDNMMPVMTGVESTRAIREQGYSGLIIGVTGNTLGEEQITFKDAGADFILGKPVNIPQLDAILAHIKKYGNLSPKSASIESKNEELIQAFEILSSEMERLGHV